MSKHQMKRLRKKKVPKNGYAIVVYRRKSAPHIPADESPYFRISSSTYWFTRKLLKERLNKKGFSTKKEAYNWIEADRESAGSPLYHYNITVRPWNKDIK